MDEYLDCRWVGSNNRNASRDESVETGDESVETRDESTGAGKNAAITFFPSNTQ